MIPQGCVYELYTGTVTLVCGTTHIKRNRFCIPIEVYPCVQSSREPHNSRLEQVEWYLPPTSPSVYFVSNTCCLSAGKWEGKTQEEWTVYVGVKHTRINCQCSDKSPVFFSLSHFSSETSKHLLTKPCKHHYVAAKPDSCEFMRTHLWWLHTSQWFMHLSISLTSADEFCLDQRKAIN